MLYRAKRLGSSWLQNIIFPVLALLVATLLLFCRLDDMYLWQDEAETALVSRHLLAYGLPLASDGRDWVQQADYPFIEFRDNYVWIFHSWLQYVLTALSFALFGPTTFAARLPFVLVGLATYALFYSFVSRWLKEERAARVATILLLFCVPFILHLRQCRYYALVAFMVLVLLDAYLQLRVGKRWAVPYLVLASVLLYHSHYGAFFPTMVALSVHLFLSKPDDKVLHQFLFALGIIVLFVSPWAYFMRVWNRGQLFLLDRFLAHLGQYTLYITIWLFPWILVPALFVAWIRRSQRTGLALSATQATFCEIAGCVILLNILVLSAFAAYDWVYFRYILHLVPLLLVLLAIIIVVIMKRQYILGAAMLAMLVTSNALHIIPYAFPGVKHINWQHLWPSSEAFGALQRLWAIGSHFRSDVLMYAQQLTHSYEGPIEGLVRYFSEHAGPGETVVVNDEELPLMFYTDLRVLGGFGLHGVLAEIKPDWVVVRKYGHYRDLLAEIISSGPYERIELPYPDIRWENRPQPGAHHYLTVRDEDNVVLYRRRGD